MTPSNAGYSFTPVELGGDDQRCEPNRRTSPQRRKPGRSPGTISPTAGGSGATVTLSGAASATTTANASGVYTFTGLANGAYTVTPSKAGYSFTPANSAVTINGANQTVELYSGGANLDNFGDDQSNGRRERRNGDAERGEQRHHHGERLGESIPSLDWPMEPTR